MERKRQLIRLLLGLLDDYTAKQSQQKQDHFLKKSLPFHHDPQTAAAKNIPKYAQELWTLLLQENQHDSQWQSMLALLATTKERIDPEALRKALLYFQQHNAADEELKLHAKFPEPVKQELLLDYREMLQAYHAGLYRSSLILAGRMLEVALHRKYYEVTGKDILETNPDIGLGKLIAKLSQHNVHFDPGIMNQIHLLNNLRIHSVHKKQELFVPNKNQTKAIILLLLEILQKLFP